MLKNTQLTQSVIKTKIDLGHIQIKDWGHLHIQIEKMRDSSWIFRGVSSPLHYPMPSIGREKVFGHYKKAQELRLFQEFKDRALAIMKDPRLNDWDWLAFAQHIGVPTRLLDWTTSPLVAIFFAIESEVDTDRVVYCFKYSKFIHEVEQKSGSPFDNKLEGRFSAPLLFDRIRAQRGLFTIHPEPTKIFYQSGMKTLLIPHKLVKDFRYRLFKYGIDFWHIYPDTEGLGRQLNWQFKNKVGLGSLFLNK